MKIEIRKGVFCTDGIAGFCTQVIVNPTTLQMTHLVVQEGEPPHAERLVPLSCITSTDDHGVNLDCTRRELGLMDPLVEQTHIQVEVPDYRGSAEAFLVGNQIFHETTTMVMAEENIPPDEITVDSYTWVEATDGQVGYVDQLEVEPESGHITALVMRAGPPWEEKRLVIPAAQIDHLETEAVFLKLDKHDVETLPVVPVSQ